MNSEVEPRVIAQIETLTDILVPDFAYLVVTDGLHCGVEPTGGHVVDYIDRHPLGMVKTQRMHPVAKRAGQRYLGTRELGSMFDLSKLCGMKVDDLDPEQRAALCFIKAMSEEGWQYWLGIDIHTSNWPNSNSLVVGADNVNYSMLGVAGVLGLKNVIVHENYPFFQYFKKFVSVETQLAPSENPLSDPIEWYKHIKMIRDLGYFGLSMIGEDIAQKLRYFTQFDLMRIDNRGLIDYGSCKLIEQLEEIEVPSAYFEPISNLPEYLQKLVPSGMSVLAGSWDDRNNSPEMPELLGYRKDGRPRRATFGSFMLEIPPPEIIL